MFCIKRMAYLTAINLSRNKFVKLTKNAFIYLTRLETIDFSFNHFKKLGPQMFASAKLLKVLRIDKFGGYTLIRSFCAKLQEISLTSRTWECSIVTTVMSQLNSQRIFMSSNEGDDFENFTCKQQIKDLNFRKG